MRKAHDLIGLTFGRLTVKGRALSRGVKASVWQCVCSCGKECLATGNQLVSGGKASCGCLKSETLKKEKTKHGMSGTRAYFTWSAMLRRCFDTKHRLFKDYGGRGITVCDRWKRFEAFAEDMGPKPVGSTLERVDVNGNYEPSNCVWASQKAQTRNQRRTIRVEVDGSSVSLAELCEERGLKYSKIRDRIRRFGWDAKRALETP